MKTPESKVKHNKSKSDVTKELPKKLSTMDGKMPTKLVNPQALLQLKKELAGQGGPLRTKPVPKLDSADLRKYATPSALSKPQKKNDTSNSVLTKMRKQFDGGRFRWLNEKLYTCTGSEAFHYFRENVELFDQYHKGFRLQVESWPTNPVHVICRWLQEKAKLMVADFGCGEALLAKTLEDIHTVHSFDLVAVNSHVVACDMAHVPLPDACVDVAVFCLSLMGTNFADYVIEANRVLKQGGDLVIAEVVSRLTDLDRFINVLKYLGFRLLSKDESNKMFILLYLKKYKNRTEAKPPADATTLLKACTYKKR